MSVCADHKSRKAALRWGKEVWSAGRGGAWAGKAGKGGGDQPEHILLENDKLKPNILYD